MLRALLSWSPEFALGTGAVMVGGGLVGGYLYNFLIGAPKDAPIPFVAWLTLLVGTAVLLLGMLLCHHMLPPEVRREDLE